MSGIETLEELQRCQQKMFWGEISPCEHLVQIYAEDGIFLDALEGFVAGGLEVGDGVIVIATGEHRVALEGRLIKRGCNLEDAELRDQYIFCDAQQTLLKFMVNGWPDEQLFETFLTEILARARGSERRVRAFGEMVALLWSEGKNGATVRLEHLWHTFCQKKAFSLLCAYPRIGFTQDAEASMNEICAAHSKVVPS
jgi:hypothetical protein